MRLAIGSVAVFDRSTRAANGVDCVQFHIQSPAQIRSAGRLRQCASACELYSRLYCCRPPVANCVKNKRDSPKSRLASKYRGSRKDRGKIAERSRKDRGQIAEPSCMATQRDATRRNATQRDATRRNAISARRNHAVFGTVVSQRRNIGVSRCLAVSRGVSRCLAVSRGVSRCLAPTVAYRRVRMSCAICSGVRRMG